MNNEFMMEEFVLIYAFRYALGRKSYAVDDMITTINRLKDKLSNKTKGIIIRDINEICERYDGIDSSFIYLDRWTELKETLEKDYVV